MTQADLDHLVAHFDTTYFEGRLAGGTTVLLDSRLEGHEDAACRNDGTCIFVSPASDHHLEGTLLHEMVHAFVYRFANDVVVKDEGSAAGRLYDTPKGRAFYGPGHDERFFSKLFEVMRARGHDPGSDFSKYFG